MPTSCAPFLNLRVMQVLENMASRSAEGQKAMLRTTAPSGNLLDTLLELLQHPCAAVSTRAAATLRNVTLCSEAKAFFLARPGRLGSMVDVLGQAGQHSTRAAYAASALWGLVYQGEKVIFHDFDHQKGIPCSPENICDDFDLINCANSPSLAAGEGSTEAAQRTGQSTCSGCKKLCNNISKGHHHNFRKEGKPHWCSRNSAGPIKGVQVTAHQATCNTLRLDFITNMRPVRAGLE